MGQGGTAQGGMGQGGTAQGGMGQGGMGQGGMGQGGMGQGGAGGMGQGGMGQGGAGGMGQGGMGQGGMGQGGAGGMGTVCLDNEVCNVLNAVCDPQDALCDTNVQCDANVACPNNGELCVAQEDMANVGACYTGCTPFAGVGCAAGEYCVDLTLLSTDGVCMKTGPAAPGQPCTGHDISTGCTTGYTCTGAANPLCTQRCDFWAAGGCTAAAANCFVGGTCDTDPVNAAAIGQPCVNAASGDPCGLVGDVAEGVCGDLGQGLVCLQWCRLNGTDCPAAKTCTDVSTGFDIGACL